MSIDQENRERPVVSNDDITVKKKSKAENFLSNFISDLVINVVVPAMERTATSLVSDTFDASKRALLSLMNFDPKNTTSQNTNKGDRPTYISYNNYYDRLTKGGFDTFTPVVNDYPYNDITFDTRGKAELVRSNLMEILRRKKYVTVGDYYDLCGIPTAPTDFNFGWVRLDTAVIHMTAKGFRIKLPKAMPIDR